MKTAEEFWQQVARTDNENECWLWQGSRHAMGYGRLRWHKRMTRAHRLAFELSKGEIPEGLFICHTCDNPPCVNPNHLFAATPSENQQDSVRKGRNRSGILYGECHGRSKLTAPQVLEIRQLYADGKFSTRQLAKRFGVAQTTIAKIVSRTGWKHI